MSTSAITRPKLMRWIPPTAAALIAFLIGQWLTLISPLLLALIIGAIVANTRIHGHSIMSGQAQLTKLLLRLGVVFLGLKLPIGDLVDIGPGALLVILGTIVVTYVVTTRLGDAMGVDRGLVSLIAAGFSICGAAAIAAVADVVKVRQRDVGLAVAMVTIFGSAMIVLVPWLGTLLGLSDHQTAVWAGASIHEVAQVVASASIIGTGAVAIAMTVKLGRVVMLAPMYAVVAHRESTIERRSISLVPWFVIGFAIAVGIRSVNVMPVEVLDVTDVLTTLLLAAGMFGLGLGIRVRDLLPLPWRVLGLATASTITAGAASLALVAIAV